MAVPRVRDLQPPPAHDVPREQYAAVIREQIRHEDDVTNHRIMWLLVVQGLLVNASVSDRAGPEARLAIALAGILVTLSAFVTLYKSYQARGYLRVLGREAKRGTLHADHLQLDGWPDRRIKGWRRAGWACPWLQRPADLLEPYLFLPTVIVLLWTTVALVEWSGLPQVTALGAALVLTFVLLFVACVVWVWAQKDAEQEPFGDSEA